VKIRIIGVETCKNCKALVKSYEKLGVNFDYWDGDRHDFQDALDEMKIDDFPVVQIVSDDGKKVLWMTDHALYPRGVSYKKVKREIERLKKT